MKELYALILVVFLTQLSFVQVINFPDAVFKSKLLATSATSNTAQSKSIDVSSLKSENYFIKIQSDKGISHSKFIKH